MQKYVAREEFSQFKQWTESNVIKLALDGQEVKSELRAFKLEFEEFKNDTATQFDRITGKLEKLEQEAIFTHAALERLERRVECLEQRMERLEQRMQGVESKVDEILVLLKKKP